MTHLKQRAPLIHKPDVNNDVLISPCISRDVIKSVHDEIGILYSTTMKIQNSLWNTELKIMVCHFLTHFQSLAYDRASLLVEHILLYISNGEANDDIPTLMNDWPAILVSRGICSHYMLHNYFICSDAIALLTRLNKNTVKRPCDYPYHKYHGVYYFKWWMCVTS